MKRSLFVSLLLLLALSLMAFRPLDGRDLTGPQPKQSNPCSSIVTGGSCVLGSDETLNSDMLVMGGSVVLEKGSKVKGDVAILGGSLAADGEITGDINLIGGNASLGEHAVVRGDVNTVGGNLSKAEGAEIRGNYNANVATPFSFFFPGQMQLPNWNNGQPAVPVNNWDPVSSGLNLLGKMFWWMFRSILWALLALLLMVLAPRPAERIAAEAAARPVESGGLGCLTVIAAAVVLGLVAITICGLPLSLIGLLLLVIAWSLGIIALGYELGKRLAQMLKQDWAPAVSAALGTFVLTLALNGIGMVWCVGWLVPAVVGSVGLGAVLLTRFGLEPPTARPAAPSGGPVGQSPLPPTTTLDGPAEVYPASSDDIPAPYTRLIDENNE